MLSCKHATHRAALRQNLLIIRSIAGRLGPRATEVLRGSETTRCAITYGYLRRRAAPPRQPFSCVKHGSPILPHVWVHRIQARWSWWERPVFCDSARCEVAARRSVIDQAAVSKDETRVSVAVHRAARSSGPGDDRGRPRLLRICKRGNASVSFLARPARAVRAPWISNIRNFEALEPHRICERKERDGLTVRSASRKPDFRNRLPCKAD
jgi:hypothetical protein